MARHNDISKAHALLEGEGWHITKGTSQTRRRAKSRCLYYMRGNGCIRKSGGCQGAGNCSMYRDV